MHNPYIPKAFFHVNATLKDEMSVPFFGNFGTEAQIISQKMPINIYFLFRLALYALHTKELFKCDSSFCVTNGSTDIWNARLPYLTIIVSPQNALARITRRARACGVLRGLTRQ